MKEPEDRADSIRKGPPWWFHAILYGCIISAATLVAILWHIVQNRAH